MLLTIRPSNSHNLNTPPHPYIYFINIETLNNEINIIPYKNQQLVLHDEPTKYSYLIKLRTVDVMIAGMIHDSMLQWAYGVNKTLEQGYPPDDGFKITQNIINMTFEGMTGTVVINEFGDRSTDQT